MAAVQIQTSEINGPLGTKAVSQILSSLYSLHRCPSTDPFGAVWTRAEAAWRENEDLQGFWVYLHKHWNGMGETGFRKWFKMNGLGQHENWEANIC